MDGLRLQVTVVGNDGVPVDTVLDVATLLHTGGKLHELTHDVERNLALRVDCKTGRYQGVESFESRRGTYYYGVVRKSPVHATEVYSARSAAIERARCLDETRTERRASKRPAEDDPVVTGESSWEQRDDECRSRAVVLD